MSLRFEVGCDLEEYREYQKTSGIHDYLKWVGVTDAVYGELGPNEVAHIKRDPSHLIVWRENNEIIGHVIWHEERVDNFRLPGEEEVRIVLERLLGEKKDFVELHKVWLEEKHRGRAMARNSLSSSKTMLGKEGLTQ